MKEMEIVNIVEKLKEGKRLITKISNYHSFTNESLKRLSKELPKSISNIEKLQLEYIGFQLYYIGELEEIGRILEKVRIDLEDEISISEMIGCINKFVKISKQSVEMVKESLTNINRYLRDEYIR